MTELLACPVCDNPAQEFHHIFPKEYGFPEDGPLIDLCSSCHQAIHMTAENLTRKNRDPNKDVHHLSVQQLNRQVTQYLVSCIIKAKYAFVKEEHPNVLRRVIIKIPQHMLTKMHKRKLDSGFKNMEDYVTSLIFKDLGNL